MKNGLFICAMLLITSCSHRVENDVTIYRKKAVALTELIKGKGTFAHIKNESEALIVSAKNVMSKLKVKMPKCASYFERIMADATKMTQLTLAQIERDYHEGEALPETDDECFNAKELIVHPATVVILSRSKDNFSVREKMEDEIVEVIEHLGLVL